MEKTKQESFVEIIETALSSASGITWDGCHKIYILMDDEQVAYQKLEGYKTLPITGGSLELLQSWWDESCGLRFIYAVSTNEEDPNAGYDPIIEQGFQY